MEAFKPYLSFANTVSNVSCSHTQEVSNDDSSEHDSDTERLNKNALDNQPNEDDIENSQNNAEYATSSAGKQANKPNRKRNTPSSSAPSSKLSINENKNKGLQFNQFLEHKIHGYFLANVLLLSINENNNIGLHFNQFLEHFVIPR
ncbi:hypothetical protein RF55_19216 [Lasius niger]|uniref:Uncharacterized protein n=1 Tax=Lasius niger TaxID=67767 RepID=A0A0J7K0A4_LASNI|nr:hypothetical protein RF55_19216 [Lasius niger]